MRRIDSSEKPAILSFSTSAFNMFSGCSVSLTAYLTAYSSMARAVGETFSKAPFFQVSQKLPILRMVEQRFLVMDDTVITIVQVRDDYRYHLTFEACKGRLAKH